MDNSTGPKTGSAPRVDFVAAYVEAARDHGWTPVAEWRARLGRSARSLARQHPAERVLGAIEVLAAVPGKTPAALPGIVAELEAGVGRGPQPGARTGRSGTVARSVDNIRQWLAGREASGGGRS